MILYSTTDLVGKLAVLFLDRNDDQPDHQTSHRHGAQESEIKAMATIHQLTSPRTMQAFLVFLFSLVVSYLVVEGQEIPDLIGWTLAGIVGYYFNTDEARFPLTGNGAHPSDPSTPPLTSGPVDFETVAQADPSSPIVRAAHLGQRVSKFVGEAFGAGDIPKRERLRPV